MWQTDKPVTRTSEELEREADNLREILRHTIQAAGGIAEPGCTDEFLARAPEEVAGLKAQCDELRAKLAAMEATLRETPCTCLIVRSASQMSAAALESGASSEIVQECARCNALSGDTSALKAALERAREECAGKWSMLYEASQKAGTEAEQRAMRFEVERDELRLHRNELQRRNSELALANQDLRAKLAELERQRDQEKLRADQLAAQNATLQATLDIYGMHARGCAYAKNPKAECTCGLAKALGFTPTDSLKAHDAEVRRKVLEELADHASYEETIFGSTGDNPQETRNWELTRKWLCDLAAKERA